jgi:2-(1,2-epoxy-1,2-dihydrophenyl)acetyl-CoA isomerase
LADEQLDAAAQELADGLARGPGFAFGVAKKMFKSMNTPTLETCLDAKAWAQGIALMTGDHAEGVESFMEKRKPDFRAR